LLEVAEAGPAVPLLVEPGRAAAATVEDVGAVGPTTGLLALDDGHELGRVLRVHGYLEFMPRLVEFGAEGERLIRLAVVPPLKTARGPDPPRAEEEKLHDIGDREGPTRRIEHATPRYLLAAYDGDELRARHRLLAHGRDL